MFEEEVLFEYTNGACAIAASDFDHDGTQDMVYTCNPLGHIQWLEHDGNLNFTSHMVIENFLGAQAIDVGDLNGDTWHDFAATANTSNKISWFQNNMDGTFTEHLVTDTWVYPSFVLLTDYSSGNSIDINSDGNPDILATACQSGRIGWFENDGNLNFTEHIIKDNWTRVSGAAVCDLDNDGDIDILAAAQAGGIVWFENTGDPDIFLEHLLFSDWDKPNYIVTGDINEDGHMDFAATSCGVSDAVGWFENDGNQNFSLNLLRENYNGARMPLISDIDEDGDLDIFSIAWVSGICSFWDNDGTSIFTEYEISVDAVDLLKLFVVDLDNDGDLDIIGSTAVFEPHHIRWWNSLDEFLVGDFSVDYASGHLPVTINFLQQNYSKPQVSSWLWDFDNDGTIDSTEPNPSFTYNEIGNYDIKLTISNGVMTEEILKEDFIRVFDGESAIEFNSSSSCISIPAAASLNLTGTFTLEGWVKPLDYGTNNVMGNGMIFFKENISVYLNNAFPLNNEKSLIVRMTHQDGTQSCMSTPVNSIYLDVGQHVAVTYNGSDELCVYLNGIEETLTEYVAPSGLIEDNSNIDLKIGNNASSGSAFVGVIDEVRVWDEVRTEAEINQFMTQYVNGTEPGLIGYWRFNEGCGSDVFDLSNQFNNGTTNNIRWHLGTPFQYTDIQVNNVPEYNQLSISNYPNPFNPTTTISFNINQSSDSATIEIYNLNGQKVKSIPVTLSPSTQHRTGLVEESGINQLKVPRSSTQLSMTQAGSRTYSVVWNGTDDNNHPVSSGIYFARIKAGKQTSSRKMLLLK